uniref:Uncharacterized protein n=1 Tax=Vitis vinifera TaxID=29760 RepID=A5BF88_VITVI|nr:hypothetical protein VITISV_007959 [Vitis vinifera]
MTLISQLRNGCEMPKRKNSQFRSQSSISQGISKLQNHLCHLEAPYTHFAAAKWLRNLHTLKSFNAHTMNRHVTAAPPFRQLLDTSRSLPEVQNYACNIWFQSLGSQESIASNSARFGFETEKLWPFEDDCANHERKYRTSISLLLDTFLKHFLELKLCIPYLVSKLGKSGVQRFKRRDAIWKGVSQLRNHFLAHECHFAAQFPSFRSCNTAAKSPLSCETTFWHMRAISKPRTLILQLQNELRNQFWAAKSLLSCEMAMK